MSLGPQLRVSFAGCWHGNLEWAYTALAQAQSRQANVLVHTGDLGHTFTREFVAHLDDAAARMRIPIWFIDGDNDDLNYLERLRRNPDGSRRLGAHLTYLPRGFTWEWEGLKCMALGGARSTEHWKGPWFDTETLRHRDIEAASRAGKIDLLISHDAPANVHITGLNLNPDPRAEVERVYAGKHRQLIQSLCDEVLQPSAIIHGHYHTYYERSVQMGHGMVNVRGLDRDRSSMFRNLVTVNMYDLKAWARKK